jgi:23S rRNA U2552 (ribose-2'-O)-methylase RlmE/FtsJ
MFALQIEKSANKNIKEHKNYYAHEKLRTKLHKTKTKLDKPYQTNGKIASIVMRQFDPFMQEKRRIGSLVKFSKVSNAWLKLYEILEYFSIGPALKKINHFDNAAFPGNFLMAAKYYAQKNKIAYDWHASSLLLKSDDTETPLEDSYGLYKDYPKNWIMDKKNNGDVTLTKNILDGAKKMKSKGINLYTSDLGFDVSDDYNQQEELQMLANFGQIVYGLQVLRQNGCFVTKQYTFFNGFTLSIMTLLASTFKEFYICKPATSREANSETYLVGKGYNRRRANIILPELMRRLKAKDLSPMFDIKDMTVPSAAFDIFRKQIVQIDKVLDAYSKVEHKKYKDVFQAVSKITKTRNGEILQAWRKLNKF